MSSVHPALDTRVFYKEALTLEKAGFDVTLIALHPKDEVISGIRIISLPEVRNRFTRMIIMTSLVFIKALKTRSELYHIHDPELIFTGMALKFLGKKVVYDVHEDYPKSMLAREYIPVAARYAVSRAVAFTERYPVKIFDAVITATDEIQKKFIFHKKSVQIRNYPFVSTINRNDDGRRDSVFKLIYIGGLTRINGISEIVRAMGHLASCRDIKLYLYGKFQSSEYGKEVASIDGFDKVEYAGWMDYAKMMETLASADIGLVCCHPVPNSINSLPNKLFEYMSAGLPVIVSDFPLWRDMIEKNNCGICVDPEDPEAIARAVERLYSNPILCREMGKNARDMITNVYNWDKEGERLVGLYKEVFSG
jgi:glycosyltransferase involved in cell wall biosynthesis